MVEYGPIIATDADEQISVAGTAATLTLPAEFSSNGVNGGRAAVEVRTAAILYTLNGTAPTDSTQTTGHLLQPGEKLTLTSLAEMRNLNIIRATATSADVFVSYQKKLT